MTNTDWSLLFLFNEICARYVLRSASLICLGSVRVAVARRAGVFARADSACLMESVCPKLGPAYSRSRRVLLGTFNGQGGIHKVPSPCCLSGSDAKRQGEHGGGVRAAGAFGALVRGYAQRGGSGQGKAEHKGRYVWLFLRNVVGSVHAGVRHLSGNPEVGAAGVRVQAENLLDRPLQRDLRIAARRCSQPTGRGARRAVST